MNFKVLNAKEVKNILKLLKNQFGYTGKLPYIFLKTKKNKLYIITKDITNLKNLNIISKGLYFGLLYNNSLRLSIEGSQLIGPKSKKNIIELTKEAMLKWMRGQDLETTYSYNGFVILKYKDDYLGCGKCKNKKILNYVPKPRRISLNSY